MRATQTDVSSDRTSPGGRTRSRRARTRSLGVVAAAVASLLMAASPFSAAAGAADIGGGDAAAWGADWLGGQIDAGIPLETFGSPDWGTTLEAGLALAAVDGHQARAAELWSIVEAERESIVNDGTADVAGRLAQVLLLAVALGEDPRAVGAAPGGDLVARLEATRTTTGADLGLYGAQFPTYDGAYRQGASLAALTAAGVTPDPTAVDWLVAQQCADGSWMPYRSDLSAACAFDGAMFVGPDSNSTAAAVLGLAAVGGRNTSVDAALGWLDDVQEADGGWSFFPGGGSDPNSTALVVQSLVATGSLAAPAFTDREGLPLAALVQFQLGCTTGEDAGAFTFPGSNDAPNAIATAQATQSAAGVTWGSSGVSAVGPFDEQCPAPTTTTTTTVVAGGSQPVATTVAGGPAPQVAGASVDRPAELALTGSATSTLLAAGALLLAAGALSLAGSRRVRAD